MSWWREILQTLKKEIFWRDLIGVGLKIFNQYSLIYMRQLCYDEMIMHENEKETQIYSCIIGNQRTDWITVSFLWFS